MQENGFTSVREFFIAGHEYGRELTYRYKDVNFDFFFIIKKMIQTIYIHILSVVHQIFYWKKVLSYRLLWQR